MTKLALIFPGQGSQSSGMGRDLYENFEAARRTFNEIDEVLERKISSLCFEGSDEDLKITTNSQPAILSVSMAAFNALKEETDIVPDFLAGHSLGEYSALCAGGVVSTKEILKLVEKRSELMSQAPSGSMSAVMGLSPEKLEELIKNSSSEGIICAANYNTPEQTVISGEARAVEKANELAVELGAKRVIPLAVSGAFHSPLMKEASEQFARFVNDTNVNDSNIPVVTNVDAKPTIDKAEFSPKMIKQIHSPVYWYQSVNNMIENGVETFIEVGPGKVLSGMIKKINRSVKVYNVSDAQSLIKVKEALTGASV